MARRVRGPRWWWFPSLLLGAALLVPAPASPAGVDPAPLRAAAVAGVFYQLGWKSPEAKRALMADVQTQDQRLRLQVQWALGHVSDDPDVVDGQTKGFLPGAEPEARRRSVVEWKLWLAEYRSNL
jgi:hypothetical protein